MTVTARRAAGTPLTENQRQELRALADMPDDQIDFSDIPERLSSPEPLPLEEHTVRLRVDAEVARWLENTGEAESHLINQLFRQLARRGTRSEASRAEDLKRAS